mgnify:CR=1 FL=1
MAAIGTEVRTQLLKLYVLAGLPGGGKTSLVWQAALATAGGDEKSKGKRVLVFSLEMTREDICQRLAAQGLGIPETRLENGAITALPASPLR